MSSRIFRLFAVVLGLVVSLIAPGRAYAAIDWAKVPAKEIVLFYPATSSWERLFTPGFHTGQRKYNDGKNCFACHGGIDEQPLGESLVASKGIKEPRPILAKPPAVKAKISFAHDADKIYVRLEFNPGQQPNSMMDKEFETKVAMMLDDGSVREAGRAGCWVTCHSNAASMTGVTKETTKYLPASRINMGRSGSDDLMPAPEIEQLRARGQYLEYWQARLKPGAPASAVDGTILEKRSENSKPQVTATATQANGVWTVIFSRKMVAGAPYKDVVPGKIYNVGFSIHAGYTTQRFHYVSFERTFVLDSGKADFVAVPRK